MDGGLPDEGQDDKNPDFYQYSVLVSSGSFILCLAIHLILFILRQVLQRRETCNLNEIIKEDYYREQSQELTTDEKNKRDASSKLTFSLNVTFALECLFLELAMISLVTYLAAAVAFNLINWGYAFGFGMTIVFFTTIHTFRKSEEVSNKLKNLHVDETPLEPNTKKKIAQSEPSSIQSLWKKVTLHFKNYLRSIYLGVFSGYRLALFLCWLFASLLITFILIGVFYGTCVCSQPYSFSTALSRNSKGRACPPNTICSVIAMLPEEPSSSMIIKFYTQDVPSSAFIFFSVVNSSNVVVTRTCSYVNLNDYILEFESRYIYNCDLTNLSSETVYNFTLVVAKSSYNQMNVTDINYYLNKPSFITFSGMPGRTAQFRTLSASPDNNVFFVTGGDQGAARLSAKMVAQASSLDPDFISIGGDLNYDNGMTSCYRRVLDGINAFAHHAFDSNGNMIPLLTAIGNHEALYYRFGATNKNDIANYLLFYSHQIGTDVNTRTTYHAHNLGGCSLLVLDSSINVPHVNQVDFIRTSWSSTNQTKMAMYHGPLYPSSRSVDNSIAVLGRLVWEPVFNEMNMTIGIENHDHTLKRTRVMRNAVPVGKDDRGVVYIGDGNMGVTPRYPFSQRSYLEYATTDSHFWTITCSLRNGVVATAIGADGLRKDNVTRASQQFI
ncbi:hypothetical protein AKO1_015474 [Acrasis kona]|uniref:Purple acid phosphatase n=1 Tax=Acrasis kona TaxID=1008807 RepID=A0AAW2ZHT1_9EUKA